MQQRYLLEAHRKFGLPVLTLPLMGQEPKGLAALTELGGVLESVDGAV